MEIDEKSAFVLFVEKLMRKQKLTYRTLAVEADLAISTINDLRNGTVPRESTLGRIAGPLDIDANKLALRLPKLYKIVNKIKITLICEYCGEPGTIYTGAPQRVKYAHEKCAKAASIKQNKEKNKSGYKLKKSKVRDMDRIKLIPQNDIYLKSLELQMMRKCLGGCEEMFMSKGPGNRVCRLCSKNLDRFTTYDRECKVVI